MTTVNFPPDLGGDDVTIDDTDSPSTGLGNGGHRLRFVLALQQFLKVATWCKDTAATVLGYRNAASDSADAAAASESAAADSATAAADALSDTEATRDQINSRYYGNAASDPVTRPDGSAMQAGDRYYNTMSSVEKVFGGSTWTVPNVGASDLANATDTSKGSALVGHSGRTVKAKLYEIVSIADFLVVSNDGGAKMQAAIDYLGANGGVITIPPGTWTWNTVPKLPAGLNNRLLIKGYGAKIVLTAAASRVFDLNKTADNQTFQKFRVRGLEVDASAATGKSHVLIGSRIANAFIGRFNADDWLFEDVVVTGMATDPAGTTNGLSFVAITPYHVTNDEATQNFVTNITFRRVRGYGGNGGFQINAFNGGATTSTNCYLDNIVLEDCVHKLASLPTQFFACSNAHIGGFGFGDRCVIKNFIGTNSGDNSIEVNAMQSTIIDNPYAEGAVNYQWYFCNYRDAQDYRSQKVTLNNPEANLTYPQSRTWSFGKETTASKPMGHFRIRDQVTRFYTFRQNGTALLAAPNGAGTKQAQSIRVDGLTIIGTLNDTISSNTFPSLITANLAGSTRIRVRNINVDITGTIALSGSPSFAPRLFDLAATADARYELDGVTVNYGVTSTTDIWGLYITGSSPNMAATKVSRFNFGNTNTGSTNVIRINGSPLGAGGNLLVSESDFSGAAAGASDVLFTDTTQRPYVRFERVRRKNLLTSSTNTPASPAVVQNTDFEAFNYIVSGGTVSLIELSFDGTNYYTTGVTAGTFRVAPGESIRVTYSSAPTIRKLPDPSV